MVDQAFADVVGAKIAEQTLDCRGSLIERLARKNDNHFRSNQPPETREISASHPRGDNSIDDELGNPKSRQRNQRAEQAKDHGAGRVSAVCAPSQSQALRDRSKRRNPCPPGRRVLTARISWKLLQLRDRRFQSFLIVFSGWQRCSEPRSIRPSRPRRRAWSAGRQIPRRRRAAMCPATACGWSPEE